jgi:lipoyl(octanoyl) transferase
VAHFVRLEGLSRYEQVHTLQRQLVDLRAAGRIDDIVLLLEHEAVITVGRKRDSGQNVLFAEGTPVVEVERGGDVTWHGPGQLVAYPILKLEGRRADLHLHLRSLEEAVLALCAELGLSPCRDERNTGVWLPSPQGDLPQKVCSVGIACRKWVSWHGLALNITVDLGVFQRIRPCGFNAEIMTRLNDHSGVSWSVEALSHPLARHLAAALEVPMSGPIRRAISPDLRTVLASIEPGD